MEKAPPARPFPGFRFWGLGSNGTVTAVKRPFEIAKNQSANLHREFTLLAISFAVAKLALLILAVCRATYAVELMRLIYQLLTIQLNRLTVFWVPLLPKPLSSYVLNFLVQGRGFYFICCLFEVLFYLKFRLWAVCFYF
ncbi:hypothetical protein GX95_24355 (plasmid) [Salmonella enterica subsp. enterica serovar Minnesota]|uniref:hypothetical protein n=1 Tax=Salmonella enterica TaxID=28901 RepID=UPI000B61A0E5|nr:hypothetical protein [Salmonella enterica]ASA54260.1 hypothetical protein GX95_24355 [Salmonella enterica subsp. enterica serovar Minnesota]EDZ3670079.1 hypothetical protein [Salmonella enterica]